MAGESSMFALCGTRPRLLVHACMPLDAWKRSPHLLASHCQHVNEQTIRKKKDGRTKDGRTKCVLASAWHIQSMPRFVLFASVPTGTHALSGHFLAQATASGCFFLLLLVETSTDFVCLCIYIREAASAVCCRIININRHASDMRMKPSAVMSLPWGKIMRGEQRTNKKRTLSSPVRMPIALTGCCADHETQNPRSFFESFNVLRTRRVRMCGGCAHVCFSFILSLLRRRVRSSCF